MSRWFRHYAGMARDDKLVRVALRSKQTVERVVWVWVAILESAAERDSEGTFEVDHEEVAYFLRCEPEEIGRIFDALQGLGRIDNDRVSKWDLRQFKADSSTERVKRHREKRAEAGLVSQWTASAALRQRVYEKDGFACVYCGSEDDLSIDHKTPERRGGDHSESNLQTACRSCNAQKRDLTHEEYVARNAETVSATRHRTETEAKEETDEAASAASSASAPALDLQEAERRCREAAGSNELGNFGPISELLHRQADLERDVLPVIRSRPALRCGVKSWRYYVPIIEEALAKRAPPSKAQGPPKVFVAVDDPDYERLCRAAKHAPSLTLQEPGSNRTGWYFPTPTSQDRSAAA